ncbi:MAG: hypothetical protein HWE08_01105 [Alphaproteobacteria bacterium]|nr:hypothetical protein [Alphaproteobacteria bacterium]
MFALLMMIAGLSLLVLVIVLVMSTLGRYRRLAREQGYASLGDYLRAAPSTDREKREAVDLALYGLAFCMVGLAFPPLVIVGVFPLFFGGRKVLYGLMGLGLMDDADETSA